MELSDDFDEVEVHGTLIYFGAVCFLLGWTCVTFDAATFPQNSTGCISYVEVDLETAGQMSVAVGVLSAKPASPTATVVAPQTPFRIAPSEICSLATEVDELTGGAAIADEPLTGEPRMEWIEATEVPDLRGLGEGVVGPPQGVHGGELGFTAPLVPIEGVRFDGLPPTIPRSEGGMAASQPLPEWPPRGGPGVPEFDVVLGIREILELIGSRLPLQLREELQGFGGGGVAGAPPVVTLTVHLP